MLIMTDGKVWLNQGEIVPVFCECGHIYQPDFDDIDIDCSSCPKCGRVNAHYGQSVQAIPFKGDD